MASETGGCMCGSFDEASSSLQTKWAEKEKKKGKKKAYGIDHILNTCSYVTLWLPCYNVDVILVEVAGAKVKNLITYNNMGVEFSIKCAN